MFSAEYLVRLRRARGFSQEELARRSGLATATVAKLEEGRSADPRTSTLAKLASGLDCPIQALVATTSESRSSQDTTDE